MIIRQGDILLMKVVEVPKDYVVLDNGKCIVGYGEVTGHVHVVEKAQWLVDTCHDINSLQQFAIDGDSPNDVFVHILQETIITHQEHDTLTIPKGTYKIIRQREYTPQGIRYVLD